MNEKKGEPGEGLGSSVGAKAKKTHMHTTCIPTYRDIFIHIIDKCRYLAINLLAIERELVQ